MLRIEGLAKRYGDIVALDGVDLAVAPGEVCALLGPNGAGKSTLVSIVAGLRRADAGAVTVDGIDALGHSDAARALIGLAPQELGVYPSLSVRDNLVFFGDLAGLGGRDLGRRVDEVAEALELTDLLTRATRTLSGGEKRRVHTAMAMIHRPPLLLLDEPTTGVDVRTRSRLLDTVRELATEDGTAICYSTHYLPEVEALDATVAIIERGRIIARGTLAELVGRHGGSAVELVFDGPAPTLEGRGLRVEVDGSVLRIRTEHPAAEAAAVIGHLGLDAERLRSLEIVAPSLESVFLALTGRRYASDLDDPEEATDAVAT